MEDNLRLLLSGAVPINSAAQLRQALDPDFKAGCPEQVDAATLAIALDTSALLKLPKDKAAVPITDHLSERFIGSLVVPTQVIQEYWNNRQAIQDVASKLSATFNELDKQVHALDPSYKKLREGADRLLSEFKNDFGHVLDASVSTSVSAMVEMVSERALTPHVDRVALHDVARQRKLTKTPPGFLDAGDGDFILWAELLSGTRGLIDNGARISDVVLVTADLKKDWSTGGEAHPVLRAEMMAYTGATFATWTIRDLEQFVERDPKVNQVAEAE